jgi:hypothetical protein
MKRLLAILMLFTLSCLEVEQSQDSNFVVEGYLYTGERVKDFRIKSLVSLDNPEGESEIISNAEVNLIKDGIEYSLAFNSLSGKYEDPSGNLIIGSVDELLLEVQVNDRVATAITQVPTPPMGMALSKDQMVIPEINSAADFIGNDPLADAEIFMEWDNPKHELHYVVIEFRSNLLRPILPPDVQEVVDGILEDFAIISPPDTISNYTISGALLPSYGPYVVKLYKVNQEYADLYESEEQDSRDLNDPPSNMINARGIFTAFAGDSLNFEIIKR